jgi:hypothetical protein
MTIPSEKDFFRKRPPRAARSIGLLPTLSDDPEITYARGVELAAKS